MLSRKSVFLRINPDTGLAVRCSFALLTANIPGEPYNVCRRCWCWVLTTPRAWAHDELEKAHPGCMAQYRALIQSHDTDSKHYRLFEEHFTGQLERCERIARDTLKLRICGLQGRVST